MITPCKTPFAHSPEDCNCVPSKLDETVKALGRHHGITAQAVFVALISFAVLFGAGAWGLSRAERAYQESARV